MPSLTPAPPLSPEQLAEASPSQVLVGFAIEPPVQSRLTILFRVILSIPLLIWSALLSVATGFLVVVSWFAALFTGRVPAGIQEFNTDVLRYITEVQAYSSVLVARWPGFSLHPGDQRQVSLQITQFKLNRGAVFFRYFLSLPASVVLFIVSFGSYALTVAVWVSALILGRPAKPLYQAHLLCMRYSTRLSAYMFLLTPTQPFTGLFGDTGIPEATSSSDASTTLSTRILPSRWARTFLVLSLIAGAFGGAIYFRSVGNFKNFIDNHIVVPMVNTAETNVVADIETYTVSLKGCIAQSSAACGTLAAVTARDAIATQISNLTSGVVFVNRGRSQYLAYVAGLTKVNSDFSLIAGDATLSEQGNDVKNKLLPDITAFNAQYQQLRAAL
jgi:hypothetical protein